MPNNQLSIKIGDTFSYEVDLTNDLGSPLVTSVINLKSQIKDLYNRLISTLTITTTSTSGKYLLQCDTTNWIAGTMLIDVQYIDGTITSSTDTVLIKVEKDVTV